MAVICVTVNKHSCVIAAIQTAQDNIAAQIADTARLMRRSFNARARGFGVTRPQWQVHSALRRHGGIHQGGLADLVEVASIIVCRMVDRLQEADLVARLNIGAPMLKARQIGVRRSKRAH